MLDTLDDWVKRVSGFARDWSALGAAWLLCLGCSAGQSASRSAPRGLSAEAGFIDLAPRNVVIHGNPVSLAATSKIFYNFRPADTDAKNKPLIVLFNGFASDVVRAFGTGPMTVEPDGTVVPNPNSLTRFANLLYFDPRQSGFSYDVIADRAPTNEDCSQQVFSEYVDAADVLLATLQFVNTHPSLQGHVYWLGESYAGVRIQWILAFLRQAWSLAPYQDDTLASAVAAAPRSRFLSGQILLEPWLFGSAHASAIQAACETPALLSAVQATLSSPCPLSDACACANYFERSPYNYTLSAAEQDARIFAADAAQVSPADAAALYGAKLDEIAGLSATDRARGFKCSVADDTTPDQSELVALLGPLPAGQAYNLAYSPLTTGKGSTNPDWRTQTLIGSAFIDNARTVDTLVTDGQRDLVVPESAFTPALRSLSGSTTVTESADAVAINYANGTRSVAIRHYPNAGHMITMIEPQQFAADLSAWLALRETAP